MRKITLLILFCCTHLMMLAQTKSTNTNESPARIKCYTTEYMAELRKNNPGMQTEEQFEQFMATAIAKRKADIARGVVQPLAGPYVITVIVHVIHNGQAVGTSPNLPQAQIASQIRVLNEDFNRTNADAINTPTGPTPAGNFAAVAGSMPGGIEFRLARQDPAGNLLAEAGVHRYQVPAQASYSRAYIEGTIKPTTSWDHTRYMNMWTMANPVSNGTLGYAQFPIAPTLNGVPAAAGGADTDGLVMAANCFGSNYTDMGVPIAQPYSLAANVDKGRTATHELGHGLGLRHIWGDGSATNLPVSCNTDFCADTPVAFGANTASCYTHPKNSTCAGTQPEMFMNYMDYTLDACMNLFTVDQMARMVTVMDLSIGRSTLTTAAIIVSACPTGAIGLTRATYPAAGLNLFYSQANGGTGNGTPNPATGAGYVYSLLVPGSLPPGLTLDTLTGVISGTATSIGNFSFTITPSGASGVDANGVSTACIGSPVAYTIQVVASSCPPITISPLAGALPNATPGVAYSQQVSISPAGTYTYMLLTGSVLPSGLTLSTAGLISGTPISPQTLVSFTVLATDASTPVACQTNINYTLAVVAPCTLPPVISSFPYLETFDGVTAQTVTAPSLPDAPVPVNLPTNTNAPCTWTIINANSDDRSWFNGTTGSTGFAVSGTNAMRYTYSDVNAANDWLISPGIAMNAGQAYNISFQFRTGGGFPENFEVKWGNSATVAAMTTQISSVVGSLATTFAANNSTITPTVAGTYYVGIRVSSTTNQYTLYIDNFSVTVCPTITPSATAAVQGTVGVAYNLNVAATTTSGTLSYSVTPALPTGLVLNATSGVISGTPSAVVSSATYTVVARTSASCSIDKLLVFAIAQNLATAINNTLSNEVKVHPNPSKAYFNVDFASLNLGKVAISVYDVQGKQVFTTSTSDNTTVISLEKFAKGMYLMEIESQKGRIFKRIVKE